MNDFLSLAARRYSVRQYDPSRPVDPALLEQVLEAARLAPTACNRQDWHVYVLTGEEAMAQARRCSPSLFNAPAALLFCSEAQAESPVGRMNGVDFPLVDATIAMTHALLAATDLGLGSCWVGLFDEAKTIAAFDLPAGRRPLGFLPLGYAAADCRPAPQHQASLSLAQLTERR